MHVAGQVEGGMYTGGALVLAAGAGCDSSPPALVVIPRRIWTHANAAGMRATAHYTVV